MQEFHSGDLCMSRLNDERTEVENYFDVEYPLKGLFPYEDYFWQSALCCNTVIVIYNSQHQRYSE